MDTLSLTWKSVTGRSAEMRQRFNSALHGAGSNLRRALLLQTVGISYQGRLHVCWITRAESFASAWNAGLEMSCCLLSNQHRLYGVCDTHLGHPENAACYHLYALGFFSSGVENKELCRQVETEKMWCGPTGFRNLRKQRKNTLDSKVWCDVNYLLNSLFIVFFHFAVKATSVLPLCCESSFRGHQWV